MQVASSCGNLDNLLTSFFSFLHRRTDFYIEVERKEFERKQATMGFPPGQAKKMILGAMGSFPIKRGTNSSEVGGGSGNPSKKIKGGGGIDKQVSLTSISKCDDKGGGDNSGKGHRTDGITKGLNTTSITTITDEKEQRGVRNSTESGSGSTTPPPSNTTTSNNNNNNNTNNNPLVQYNEKGEQIPIPGNGGICSKEGYYWLQQLNEVRIDSWYKKTHLHQKGVLLSL